MLSVVSGSCLGKLIDSLQTSIPADDAKHTDWFHFARGWADQGFAPNEVVYIKGLGDGSLETVSEALSHPKERVAELVVDKIDKIVHEMEMSTVGMQNQVASGPSSRT